MNGTSPNYSKTGSCAAFYLFSLIGITAVAQPTDQENWLNFRGPTFNGTSLSANPPLHWSETKNVKWKVELPGSGNNSSPIVWNDRVIVLDTIPESQQAPPPAGVPSPSKTRRPSGSHQAISGRRCRLAWMYAQAPSRCTILPHFSPHSHGRC